MDLWEAIVLGLVEGLTEYLPISSTGHLLLAQRALGIAPGEAANAYAVVIQGGAIAAVLGLYARRVGQMLRGLSGRDAAGGRLARALLVAFLPAAALGLALDDVIERSLFGPWPVVAAWIAGGVLLLALGRRGRLAPGIPGAALEALTPSQALWIGLAQCAALWPGVSRSLATILGGVLAGLALPAAVEFSFLLGLVTLGAAAAYKAVGSAAALTTAYPAAPLLAGFAVAWLAAAVAVRWMVGYLHRHGMALFGWYRIGLGLAVAALLAGGWL